MDFILHDFFCQIIRVLQETEYEVIKDDTKFKERMVMKSFLRDCRPATSPSALSSEPKGSAESEAFVISWSYGMGDPLAPSEARGTGRGEACPPRRASPVRNSLK